MAGRGLCKAWREGWGEGGSVLHSRALWHLCTGMSPDRSRHCTQGPEVPLCPGQEAGLQGWGQGFTEEPVADRQTTDNRKGL